MDDAGQIPTVPARLRWLFETTATRAPGDGSTAEPTWRAHTVAEVVRVLGGELGIEATAATSLLSRLQAGRADAPDAALAVIARFFGIDVGYFGSDPVVVGAAQDQVLDRALRDAEVDLVAMCRTFVLSPERRRARLRFVLDIARTTRAPTQQPGGVGPTNIGKVSSPGVRACHHRGRADLGRGSSVAGRAGPAGGKMRTRSSLTTREIRELCVHLLCDLDIVPPLDPRLLCQRVSEHRGRRIKLLAEEVFTTSSVGHLICKPRHDVIVYQRTAPLAQQAHVIYHELIHLVRGHLDGSESLTCGALDTAADPAQPGLYSDWQEWEAETGATVLSELSRQPADPRLLARDTPAPEGGLAAAFGLIREGWRR